MHIPKKGIRALGIAESYTGRNTDGAHSTICGVVMRKDLRIDGIAFGKATVGGMDATDVVLTIFRGLRRQDINFLMLSGCVIAWFNVIDPERLHDETGLPVIGVTYEDSAGLEEDILHHFPDDQARLTAYRRLGERRPLALPTGYQAFIRSWGIGKADAGVLCSAFTREGKIPEPLRVARLCARAGSAFRDCGRK
jgi:endonuclease V-like protein UPF0215 family